MKSTMYHAYITILFLGPYWRGYLSPQGPHMCQRIWGLYEINNRLFTTLYGIITWPFSAYYLCARCSIPILVPKLNDVIKYANFIKWQSYEWNKIRYKTNRYKFLNWIKSDKKLTGTNLGARGVALMTGTLWCDRVFSMLLYTWSSAETW